MANIKDYVYGLEQEIAETIGFTVSKNNIRVVNEKYLDGHWTYVDGKILVSEIDVNQNQAKIDFSIAHELGHMVQGFIYGANIEHETLTKEKYEEALNKFFKTKDIHVTDEMFKKFTDFLKESPFADKDITRLMKFDHDYYVGDNDTNPKLYTQNTNEIHANVFAFKCIFDKYQKENASNELMQNLKREVERHYKHFSDKNLERKTSDFYEQVSMFKKNTEEKLKHWRYALNRPFVKRAYEHDLQKRINEGMEKPESYDFKKQQIQHAKHCQMIEGIFKEINLNHGGLELIQDAKQKTEKAIDDLVDSLKGKYTVDRSKYVICDNFEPCEQDKKFIRPIDFNGKSYDEMVKKVESLFYNTAVAVVMDFEQKMVYVYNNTPSQPIKPMEQGDAVLEGDTQRVQEEEKENQTILKQPNMEERF